MSKVFVFYTYSKGLLKIKGELPIPAAFGDVNLVNIADMLLDEGDAIVNVDGLPHFLTKYGEWNQLFGK